MLSFNHKQASSCLLVVVTPMTCDMLGVLWLVKSRSLVWRCPSWRVILWMKRPSTRLIVWPCFVFILLFMSVIRRFITCVARLLCYIGPKKEPPPCTYILAVEPQQGIHFNYVFTPTPYQIFNRCAARHPRTINPGTALRKNIKKSFCGHLSLLYHIYSKCCVSVTSLHFLMTKIQFF